jgi:hypothetical protein
MMLDDLEGWLGSWRGTWRTWLQPDVLHDESAVDLDVQRSDEDWLLTYRGTIGDDPVTGTIRIHTGRGADAATEVTWRDTWHTAGEEQHLVGDAGDPPSYTYGPPEDPWTWTIDVAVTPTTLLITHWNTPPDGPTALAVSMTVGR